MAATSSSTAVEPGMPGPSSRGALARLSAAELANFAKTAAEQVVQVWKDQAAGRAVDMNDEVVQLALDWLRAAPKKIPDPDSKSPKRQSEAYFVLWAHTLDGLWNVQYWNGVFSGLAYKRQFHDYEIQTFLRGLLTIGTKLNLTVMQGRWEAFSERELVTLAFLTAPDCRWNAEQAKQAVQDLSKLVVRDSLRGYVRNYFDRELLKFDNDFELVDYSTGSIRKEIFYLAPGVENKILKQKWYNLPPVGCSDTPASASNNLGTYSAFSALPCELRVKICRYLFKFNTKVEIQCAPYDITETNVDPPKWYGFFVMTPETLFTAFGLEEEQEYIRWDDLSKFFALAATNWVNRQVALKVFFENNFVLDFRPGHIFNFEQQEAHFGQWMSVIGDQAQKFAKTNASLKKSYWRQKLLELRQAQGMDD
ncbi:hypothetical protein BDU57DRAFT_541087 [Ampelomyces quisqualis]|uniref:Uncharacterized protein n=1 Tax=Ampelomyces quisqualis TaxID=50730 RepID=A0A6A5QFU4_AMPQU|nr:hypothetical protein BDU57DRAFT_541087 [Ampelomyces quisqualis]